MLSTYNSYQLLSKNVQTSLDRTARQPMAARDIAYYKANIGKVKSIDDFLKDSRLFNFAMKAFGLGDLAYAKGLMKKVLEQGVSDPASFANRLSDVRYKDFAKTFDFARLGPFTTTMSEATTAVVDKYVRQSMEETAGQDNEGVRLALYFQRNAAKFTNGLSVLADKAALKVVQTAYNLPAAMSLSSIDAQAAMIEGKVDFKALQTPAGLEKFLKRFTSMWDLSHPQSTSGAATLMGSAAGPQGLVSVDTLMSIARMRTGG